MPDEQTIILDLNLIFSQAKLKYFFTGFVDCKSIYN